MSEQKDLIAIEGIVDNTFRARDKETNEIIKKAPLTIIIQTKIKKECLKIWPGELLEKVEQKIQQGDKIFVTVPEGKKDDYQSNRYNQEIIGYNFRSESTLIINDDILITPANKLAENVQAQQAGIGPTEDEMIEAELTAHEEVEKLPVKLKKTATKKKELDKDLTVIDKQKSLANQQGRI